MTKTNVTFITDDNYYDFFLVALKSLLKSTSSEMTIKAILTFKIDENVKKLEKEINESHNHVDFSFIYFDEQKYLSNIKSKNHVSKAAYAKMFLPAILQDINKVIFLDSDILVNDDISKLWSLFEKNSFTLGAVWDPGYDQDNNVFNITKETKTFNSGVMLMDLERMRKNKDSTALAKFVEEKNHLTYLNDQAAFNAVYLNNWLELPTRWNVQYNFYFVKHKVLDLAKEEQNSVLENPGIVHFTGKSKPWQKRNAHPFKQQFQMYYEKPLDENGLVKDIWQYNYERITLRTRFDISTILKKKLKLRNLKKFSIR